MSQKVRKIKLTMVRPFSSHSSSPSSNNDNETEAGSEIDMTVTDPFAATETVKTEVTGPGERNANQRYSAAQRALREKYAVEFQALLEQEYENDGVAYQRRMTAEERAQLLLEQKRAAAAEKIAQLQEEYGL